ncbi:Granzyme M [Sesbania bispinosa]|nr:Granzyme M [Sesbania bispinosa]
MFAEGCPFLLGSGVVGVFGCASMAIASVRRGLDGRQTCSDSVPARERRWLRLALVYDRDDGNAWISAAILEVVVALWSRQRP